MPLYPGVTGALESVPSNLSPIGLQRGESHYLFGVLETGNPEATQLPITDNTVALETIIAGQASIAVALGPGAEGNPTPMVSLELLFSGAPGTFEMDIQEADTDADAFYVTMSNTAYQVTAVNATTFVARVDLSPTGGKFMRVYMKTLTNAVKTQVKVTRLA